MENTINYRSNDESKVQYISLIKSPTTTYPIEIQKQRYKQQSRRNNELGQSITKARIIKVLPEFSRTQSSCSLFIFFSLIYAFAPFPPSPSLSIFLSDPAFDSLGESPIAVFISIFISSFGVATNNESCFMERGKSIPTKSKSHTTRQRRTNKHSIYCFFLLFHYETA